MNSASVGSQTVVDGSAKRVFFQEFATFYTCTQRRNVCMIVKYFVKRIKVLQCAHPKGYFNFQTNLFSIKLWSQHWECQRLKETISGTGTVMWTWREHKNSKHIAILKKRDEIQGRREYIPANPLWISPNFACLKHTGPWPSVRYRGSSGTAICWTEASD